MCTKSGHLYEKRLIEQHLQATGRDPVTGDEATTADLLAVKGAHDCSASAALPQRVREASQDVRPVVHIACCLRVRSLQPTRS